MYKYNVMEIGPKSFYVAFVELWNLILEWKYKNSSLNYHRTLGTSLLSKQSHLNLHSFNIRIKHIERF